MADIVPLTHKAANLAGIPFVSVTKFRYSCISVVSHFALLHHQICHVEVSIFKIFIVEDGF